MFLQLYRYAGGWDNGPYALAAPYLQADPVNIAHLIDQQWGLRDTILYPETGPIHALPGNENPHVNGYYPYHLIYAYMIENTRIYEIVEKIIFEFAHSEKLGYAMQPGTYEWLRATEELFYRSNADYLIQSFQSHIRPDIRASRRNAYYRMFGLDLNHGSGGGASYPYHRPASANKEFVQLFEEFLAEVWVGITNINNGIGPDPTDEPKINYLIRRLRELLNSRRQYGSLAREEFFHVTTMSWLHLTLLVDDAPIVQDMHVAAESPAERLRQMGERVGYPCHPKADAFFQMAEPLGVILFALERLPYLNAQHFYGPPGGMGILRPQIDLAITNWSIATGRDLKSVKVRTVNAAVR